LGVALAQTLGLPYVDGDDLHSQSCIAKMTAGQPLTDIDRKPWLELIRTTAEHMSLQQQADVKLTGRSGVVVACSALKKYYRDILRGWKQVVPEADTSPEHLEPLHPDMLATYFVFIKGTREVLLERMEKRTGHYMKPAMLDSQLSTLESPEGEDNVIVVSAEDTTLEQLEKVREGMLEDW
jgi:gluconokinase